MLKKALMILMSRNALPVDRLQQKALFSEFADTFSWKVMIKMDEIEKMRQHAAALKIQKRMIIESSDGDGVKMI